MGKKGKQRYIDMPTHRHNGFAYTDKEIGDIKRWWIILTYKLDESKFNSVSKQSWKTEYLVSANWHEVLPGLWERGLIGPARLDDAVRYQKQTDKSFDDKYKTDYLRDSGWSLYQNKWRNRTINKTLPLMQAYKYQKNLDGVTVYGITRKI
jgi:hypothetical protein